MKGRFSRKAMQEITRQIRWLEQQIPPARHQLEHACGRLQRMQQALQEFLQRYYTTLEDVIPHLSDQLPASSLLPDTTSKHTKAALKIDTSHAMQLAQSRTLTEPDLPGSKPQPNHTPASHHARIKRLYHRLAKVLHPDANPGDAHAPLRFIQLQHAYRHRDLAGLQRLAAQYLIARHTQKETPVQRLERLEAEYAALHNSHDHIKLALHQLERSSEWALYQRVRQEQHEGNDLMLQICTRLKQQFGYLSPAISA